MIRAGLFHDERTMWHFGAVHAGTMQAGGWVQPPSGGGYLGEAPEAKRRILSLAEVSGLAAAFDRRTAAEANEEDLRRVHPAAYLDLLRGLGAGDGGWAGYDASMGPGGDAIARLSAGLAIEAVEAVMTGALRRAYAMTRPPGHHCLADRGFGYCLLANGAIAVETAIARHGLSRVAILDWDVHHGNGTQSIFYDRPDVLTISLHQENCFPVGQGAADERGEGRGAGCNLNVPLLPGGGHRAYADAMDLIVEPALRAYRPQLILVSSGFDGNAFDPLARMMAHSETYRMLMARTIAIADDLCGGRVVVLHEGGYSESYVPFCAHALLEELAGVATAVVDPSLETVRARQPSAPALALQRRLLEEQAAALGLRRDIDGIGR